MSDTGDGWCIECGEFFHLDDVGGYNPPCPGCGNCRECCECHGARDEDEYWPDEDEQEAPSPAAPPEGGTDG